MIDGPQSGQPKLVRRSELLLEILPKLQELYQLLQNLGENHPDLKATFEDFCKRELSTERDFAAVMELKDSCELLISYLAIMQIKQMLAGGKP